jgi:hypothetical protein
VRILLPPQRTLLHVLLPLLLLCLPLVPQHDGVVCQQTLLQVVLILLQQTNTAHKQAELNGLQAYEAAGSCRPQVTHFHAVDTTTNDSLSHVTSAAV